MAIVTIAYPRRLIQISRIASILLPSTPVQHCLPSYRRVMSSSSNRKQSNFAHLPLSTSGPLKCPWRVIISCKRFSVMLKQQSRVWNCWRRLHLIKAQHSLRKRGRHSIFMAYYLPMFRHWRSKSLGHIRSTTAVQMR